MSSSRDPVFNSMIARAVSYLRARMCVDLTFAGLVEPSTGWVTIRYVKGNRTDFLRGLTLPAGTSIGGRVARERRPILATIGRSRSLDAVPPDFAAKDEGIRSIFAVPVCVGGSTRAVIYGGRRCYEPITRAAVEPALAAARGIEQHLAETSSRRALPMPAAKRVDMAAYSQAISKLTDLAEPFEHDPPTRMKLASVFALLEQAVGGPSNNSPGGLHVTKREAEVLDLVARGHSNAEVADRLTVSLETVRAHMRSVREKLGVRNRTAAVHVAREVGLIA